MLFPIRLRQRLLGSRQNICRTFAVLTLVVFASCTSASTARPTRDTNIITRDQVLGGNYSTAFEVVRGLHPNWLVRRGRSSGASAPVIRVYVDNVSYGDPSQLRNVQASTIESIQRIDPGTATTRWGTGHSEGVIFVTTYRRPPGGASTENR